MEKNFLEKKTFNDKIAEKKFVVFYRFSFVFLYKRSKRGGNLV